MKSIFPIWALLFLVGLLYCCSSIPEGVVAVKNFDKEMYLGKWFEIARLDFFFEKGLNNTTAEYSLLDSGSIEVVNAGYNYEKNKWEKAVGNARFRGSDRIGELEVSFLGPFYSGYNIILLDKDYRYALVAGNSKEYLWILSRDKVIPEGIRDEYVNLAKALGYNTDRLIWVEHNL